MTTNTERRSAATMVNRSPFFYGWVVWLVGTVALSASMPGQTASVSLFIDRWMVDFGLENRSTISGLYGAGTFIASLGLTYIGTQLDRFGGRRVGAIAVVLFALALVFMSLITNLWMLAIGFVLIRMLGQATLPLIGTTSVANWFERLRGRAIAMMFIGFGLFQRVYLPGVANLLERYAWQTVWLFMAAALVVIVLPLITIFLRRKPEDFGMRPDGAVPAAQTEAEVEAEAALELEANYTLREVMRLPIFWVFLAGQWMPPTFVTAIIFHQESLFTSLGYGATDGATAIANASLLSAFLVLPIGAMIDRIRPSFVLSLELAALIGSMALSIVMSGPALLWVWVLCIAWVQATMGVFSGSVWTNLFGRTSQGQIRGFVATIQVIGTSVGPILLALSFDLAGSYTLSLIGASMLIALPMVGALFMTKPRPRNLESAAA
ncbi:MAG: MFS transporter [Chloroflexota bacterium]